MKRVGSAWRPVIVIAVAAVLSSSALAAAGYYRWTDDAGKVQFTQQPPDGRPYQFIRTSTGTAEASQSTAADPAANAAGADAQSPQPIGAFQGVPAKDPERCEQARTNLNVLSTSARIRSQGDDGEYRYLTPEEIDGQKKLAQEAADVYCE